MKLYYSPGACSLAPHIIANEAGVSLELVKVDIHGGHKTESGEDFYKINPKGYVPALMLDDGTLLTEGPAVQLYVADLKPDAKLVPASGVARYKMIEWLCFINSEIHRAFEPLFGDASAEEKAESAAKIKTRFDYVSGQLDGKQFLTGDTFTAADAYLFVMTTWAHHMKVEMPANFHDFFVRISKRPAVHQAMKEEGLVK
jgi:glutathione S-transferase